MITLDSSAEALEVVLGEVIGTVNAHYFVTYVDVSDKIYTPGNGAGSTNGTTAVVALAGTKDGIQRQLKFLSLVNRDTIAHGVTVRFDDGSAEYLLWSGTLAVDESVQYVDTDGWSTLDALGNRKATLMGSGVADGDYGDVTVSGGGTAMVVDTTVNSAALRAALSDETGTGSAVFANTPTLVTPVLGTPTSGTLTNCTGLPIASGVSGLAANVATFLATPSSANLAAAVTDETGTGAAVFANTPTLVTPLLGTPTSGVLTNCTGLTVTTGLAGLANNGEFVERVNGANVAQLHYGTAFPASPYNGMLFCRTDLDYCMFIRDTGRSVWRTLDSFELAFTNQTTISAAANFRLFQGPVGTSTVGYLTKWDCIVTEISACRVTSGADATADLYTAGIIATGASITVGSGAVTAVTTGLNIAIGGGVVLNAIANAGGAWTGGGHVIYTLHRTAT